MSPEFYAIIGIGVGLASLMLGLAGLMLYLITQTNRRIDRLEDSVTQRIGRLEDSVTQRFNRLEDKTDRMQEQLNDIDKRLLKVEWSLNYLATGQIRTNPPDLEEE